MAHLSQKRAYHMANGLYTLTVRDYDRETSSHRVHTGQVTALTIAGLLTEVGAYRDAVDDITIGTLAKESLHVFDTKLSSAKPSDKAAQRENKWLVSYYDNTAEIGVGVPNEGYQKIFTFEIGTADLSKLATDSDLADSTNGEIIAFKSAFEAMAKSPYGGDAVLISLKSIGDRS
jgi:hypothetical protein